MQLVPHLRTACCQLRSNPLHVQVEDGIECLAMLMELLVGLSTVPGFGTYHWGACAKEESIVGPGCEFMHIHIALSDANVGISPCF